MSRKKAAGENTPSGRGGKREGAGLKPRHGTAVVSRSINLPPAGWDLMDEIKGDLSRSEWVLKALLQADIARIKS